MDAHLLSVAVILFTALFVPAFWFWVLPVNKAKRLALVTIVFGTITTTATFFDGLALLGVLGGPMILALWIVPSALVWRYRNYFSDVNQRHLVFLQIFRVIGGLFILEMVRGHIPASFALPAGIGDIVVGLVALALAVSYKVIPVWGVRLVLVLGIADFASALFFGFTSQPGPAQLFAHGFDNQVNLFPTGVIPIFLVPYALVFHTISYINLKK
jgi:hypothetical protein